MKLLLPRDTDIILGGGGIGRYHAGNKWFRRQLEPLKIYYQQIEGRADKRTFLTSILQEIIASGRCFYKKESPNKYCIVGLDDRFHDGHLILEHKVRNLLSARARAATITSDMRPQRKIRREGNQKDDEEQDASDVAPTQGGDEGGTGDAMEDGDSWGGDGQNEYNCEGVDNGDVQSEEGKQSHVLPEEITATANDDEKEHEIKKKSVVAELEEELKAKKTEMDTQLVTTVTSRLEERVAKDAANSKVEEMTKKFEAESGAVAELKKEVVARLELNASLRNVKEEELTDDEDFVARLKQKRTDQILEELQTKNAKIQELTTENEQLKDIVRDKVEEITALKQQLIEIVQNRAEVETSEMI